MSDPRLYCDLALSEGASIPLDKDASHYLVSVMRRREGETVRLFNGKDGEWTAEISTANRKGALLTVQARLRASAGVPDVDLLFAPVKKARTDFIVEKATELGVRRLRPVITRRTIAERVRTDRLAALAREAAEQTERFDLPEIAEAEALERVLAGWPEERVLIFCDEAGDAAPMAQALAGLGGRPVAILTGPEGGFTPEEREIIRAIPSAIPVSLGPRILRADTAAAAALTLFQAICGDWAGDAQPRE
ncbi:16S rRNA (uracil(1498)-N(3))-methyltransferase [Hyphobacterium sp. HN65]|uniref:Ribosomal RNA small subunit methyltransferase E n=1 Tax=Hyphobacterium lacteum TaxID=3116575 RepID=A0ABU7LN16_9PROT|nr:16S rRNA (uracil(1498)-N(3))-methyltransferase [Hyphobacterium sp. HN65]MEE2525318.1 16S rRNA (uracil(1498)-N(3))-methyltransferase [Hyphobacterium sp. HN65]